METRLIVQTIFELSAVIGSVVMLINENKIIIFEDRLKEKIISIFKTHKTNNRNF